MHTDMVMIVSWKVSQTMVLGQAVDGRLFHIGPQYIGPEKKKNNSVKLVLFSK